MLVKTFCTREKIAITIYVYKKVLEKNLGNDHKVVPCPSAVLKKLVIMSENWRIIREFRWYSVSDWGRVRSDKSGRFLALNENQSGLVYVGLVRQGIQYHRSVPLLVSKAFIRRPAGPFDTPINLDGDRFNNNVNNLAWRPRWFALKYHRQFRWPPSDPIDEPIFDIDTNVISQNSFECAITYGLLEAEIIDSVYTGHPVWPTHQRFAILEE